VTMTQAEMNLAGRPNRLRLCTCMSGAPRKGRKERGILVNRNRAQMRLRPA
jgi:hypothetical protein